MACRAAFVAALSLLPARFLCWEQGLPADLFRNLTWLDTARLSRRSQIQAAHEQIHRELDDMQRPADCAAARVLLIDFSGDGLGSILVALTSALAEAYYSNRTLVVGPTQLPYAPPVRECGNHSLGCFFEPISKCSVSDISIAAWMEYESGSGFDDSSQVKQHNEARGNAAFLAPPNRLRHSPEAGQVWASGILSWVFRLQPELALLMRESEASLRVCQWPRPLVGMHVRQADTLMVPQRPRLSFTCELQPVQPPSISSLPHTTAHALAPARLGCSAHGFECVRACVRACVERLRVCIHSFLRCDPLPIPFCFHDLRRNRQHRR